MSATQIQRLIYGVPSHHLADTTAAQDKRCYIVHAMPNIASTVGESATVLSTTAADKDFALRQLPPELEDLAECIFTSIGSVTRVGPALMNTASVTGASTVAFFTTVLEGVVRGATDMGLSESDALHLAAQAMKGTAEMVLRGGEIANTTSSPSEIRDEVMTPNGCTARGVEVLQRARVKDVFAEATRKAVERVFEMDGSKTCQC
jgi:pyrroline-5-carboxylate reductase